MLKYTQEWEKTVTRQARWVDFENDYKTMDLDYMESVMWAFKQLWDKGLIYQSNRVLPYSWGAETPLSNHEIRLDDATRPRQDPAITVAFQLDDPSGLPGDAGSPAKILAWTTTPWTLPSNLALAVGPDLDYAVMARRPTARAIVLGEAVVEKYAKQLENATHVGTVTGDDPHRSHLHAAVPVLRRHGRGRPDQGAPRHRAGLPDPRPATSSTPPRERAWSTWPRASVRTTSVSSARPASAWWCPVDDSGRFTDDVPEWAGENVLEANSGIIKHLRETGQLVRHDSYTHNYPHCWRTDTPIIYKAMPSLVREGHRHPRPTARDQPGDQLGPRPHPAMAVSASGWPAPATGRSAATGSGVRRSRCGSATTPSIRALTCTAASTNSSVTSASGPTNLHRPYIDELVRPNPDDPTGRSMMVRVPEVLDCWFESGSMPFAQVHYPFENKEWFDEHFPADFIVEYINQSRGWFYTLHVLATALFDRPALPERRSATASCSPTTAPSSPRSSATTPSRRADLREPGLRCPAVVLHVHQHRAGR